MEYYQLLLPLALILILSKFLGLGCKKIGLPQVVGMLLAGVVIGLLQYIPNQSIINGAVKEGLGFIAKIGVILIMFSAGMETDLKVIKATGPEAFVITILGVVFPLGLGFLVAFLFFPQAGIYSQLFYGVVLTATSVSVTVATLKELGKLNSPIGTAIVSAAILDDIIGIVLLSLISGLAGSNAAGSSGDVLGRLFAPVFSGALGAITVLIKICLFFGFIFGFGLMFRYLFKKMQNKYPHHRRLAVLGFGICFLFAYLSEAVFGIADITGAFFAGLMLSGLSEAHYVDIKVEQSNYLLFAPVFFANIGINSSFTGITMGMLAFGACYIGAALAGKFLGCGLGALMFKCSVKDSCRAGIGMMARAEVVLVCTQKGVDYGLLSPTLYPIILVLIILTSFVVPVLLKLTYKNEVNLKLLTGKSSDAILCTAPTVGDSGATASPSVPSSEVADSNNSKLPE